MIGSRLRRPAIPSALAALVWCLLFALPSAAQSTDTPDSVAPLLERIQQIILAHQGDRYLDLLYPTSDRAKAADFIASFDPQATRVVVRERDRRALSGIQAGDGFRLMVEVFTEIGARGRIDTWRLDVRRMPRQVERAEDPAITPDWRVLTQEVLTTVEGLQRLTLTATKQYAAKNLSVLSEDFQLTLTDGVVFASEDEQGTSALVLLGRGEMSFKPSVASERGQLRIFCGAETLTTRFDAAFVRLNPQEFDDRVSRQALRETAVNPRDLRRAQEVFRTNSGKSFALDLTDLSQENWSLRPALGDFLAEVQTRKYSTLTYARSGGEYEDITLFDRQRQRNISVYASQQKLASRGRFYSEDARTDYDVLDYNVDATFMPQQGWIQGQTRLRLKVRSFALATLSLKLADELTIRSIVSDELGRLLHIRVKNQNSFVINLPTAVVQGQELSLTVAYAGALRGQTPDREALYQNQRDQDRLPPVIGEPSYLYSHRSYWYPQASVTDYATATLRLTVPADYSCVASGELVPGSPVTIGTRTRDANDATKVYVFQARQPLRYLATVISRFVRMSGNVLSVPRSTRQAEPTPGGGVQTTPPVQVPPVDQVQIAVEANPRQQGRGPALSARAADILGYYTSLVGDCPYPSFTIAVIENDLPGGHSPAYFAALNQPVPQLSGHLTWRNDPASFNGFPDFFLAHEAAHQWWGQAVGWKNFHEQWLSEGIAQYFAALYAQHQRGDEVFGDIIRQFRRWALDESDEGPISLGYRLGHVKNDGRIFRALIYNKSAAVLHMLRRLIGDEAFFNGLRRFYATWRYQKAGTDDLRKAFEAETSRSLDRFFDRWIFENGVPQARFSSRVDGTDLVVRFEQIGDIFDYPVTVTIAYADRQSADVIVAVDDRVTEARLRLAGTFRSASVNRDESTLATFVR